MSVFFKSLFAHTIMLHYVLGGLYLITLMKVREKGNCWRFNSPVVLELRRLGNIGRTAATSHTKFPVSVQRLPITLNPQLVDNGY